jgi:iron complex outermembrane receptor protein
MKKRIYFLTSILLMVSLTNTLSAQQDSIFMLSLEQLLNIKVFSASKSAEKITDAPATVYVVTHEQIDQRGYSSLIDLLEDIPQIEVQRRGLAETNEYITINGVAGNAKFILLMDGIRVNSAAGSENAVSYNYSIENVKQVEIILGPASALYGADAFTGIINIVTLKGYEIKGVHVKASYGAFKTTDNAITAGFGNNDASISFTGKYYHSDEPFMPDYYPTEFSWYNKYKQTGEMKLFGSTVKVPIKNWSTATDAYSIHVRANLKKFEFGYSNHYDSFCNSWVYSPEIAIYSKDAVWSSLIQNIYGTHSFSLLDNKITLQTTVSGQSFKVNPKSNFDNQYGGYGAAYKYSKELTLKAEEQISYNLNESHSFIGGLSYQYFNSIPKTSDLPFKYDESKKPDEQNIYFPGTNMTDLNGKDLTIIQDIYNIKYSNFGSFLQYQGKWFDNFTITAGTRFDYNSNYGSTINPRIGIVYKPIDKFTIKLLYGSAYLSPSPYIAYQYFGSFYPVSNASGKITGLASSFWRLTNPDLKPEKRTSFDAYLLYYILKDLAISVHGYYSDIENLITNGSFFNETFHGIPVDFVNKPINKGTSLVYGSTVRLDYIKNISNSFKINAFTAYTYSDGDIQDNPLFFSSRDIFRVGVGSQFSRFTIYADYRYQSGAYAFISTKANPLKADAYHVLNLYVDCNILKREKINAKLYLKVNNALDARYFNAGHESLINIPQDPRKIVAGLKVDI